MGGRKNQSSAPSHGRKKSVSFKPRSQPAAHRHSSSSSSGALSSVSSSSLSDPPTRSTSVQMIHQIPRGEPEVQNNPQLAGSIVNRFINSIQEKNLACGLFDAIPMRNTASRSTSSKAQVHSSSIVPTGISPSQAFYQKYLQLISHQQQQQQQQQQQNEQERRQQPNFMPFQQRPSALIRSPLSRNGISEISEAPFALSSPANSLTPPTIGIFPSRTIAAGVAPTIPFGLISSNATSLGIIESALNSSTANSTATSSSGVAPCRVSSTGIVPACRAMSFGMSSGFQTELQSGKTSSVSRGASSSIPVHYRPTDSEVSNINLLRSVPRNVLCTTPNNTPSPTMTRAPSTASTTPPSAPYIYMTSPPGPLLPLSRVPASAFTLSNQPKKVTATDPETQEAEKMWSEMLVTAAKMQTTVASLTAQLRNAYSETSDILYTSCRIRDISETVAHESTEIAEKLKECDKEYQDAIRKVEVLQDFKNSSQEELDDVAELLLQAALVAKQEASLANRLQQQGKCFNGTRASPKFSSSASNKSSQCLNELRQIGESNSCRFEDNAPSSFSTTSSMANEFSSLVHQFKRDFAQSEKMAKEIKQRTIGKSKEAEEAAKRNILAAEELTAKNDKLEETCTYYKQLTKQTDYGNLSNDDLKKLSSKLSKLYRDATLEIAKRQINNSAEMYGASVGGGSFTNYDADEGQEIPSVSTCCSICGTESLELTSLKSPVSNTGDCSPCIHKVCSSCKEAVIGCPFCKRSNIS